MPETRAKGGFKPIWVVYGVGGAIVLYVGYRLYQDHQANVAATGTTSGAPTSGGIGTGGILGGSADGSTGSTTGTASGSGFSSIAAWQEAALAFINKIKKKNGQAYLGSTEGYNAVSSWLAGICVNQRQANALASMLESVGAPPGYSVLPPITICQPTPGTTTSHTPIPKHPHGGQPDRDPVNSVINRVVHQVGGGGAGGGGTPRRHLIARKPTVSPLQKVRELVRPRR